MSELQDSIYDSIIKGNTTALNVLFEDEKVIAFYERDPIAQQHIVVLAKTLSITALNQIDHESEEHKALLGHMMVVAAQVARDAKLEQGYRIVMNTGKEGG